MDILTSVVPVAPSVLVAFLAGFIFLYRAWPYLLIRDKRPLYAGNGLKPNDASAAAVAAAAITEKQEEANVVSKEPEFPADWLVGKETYELERRAIFSKTWICLAHRSRFAKPGDYQSFQVAGFPIFLVQGKDGQVRAFHNVCRHRAYTVIEKECGSSPVLLCRYHGWSYNTFGNLIKAPHFDHVPGFQRSQNSLFEIHTVTSDDGFLFLKFDASQTVSPPETDALDAFVQSNGLQTRAGWVTGQTIEGAFNWKMGITSREFLNADHLGRELREQSALPLMASIARYFHKRSGHHMVLPITSIHTIPGTGFWYSLVFLPISESRTAIRYDLYCNKATPNSYAISDVIVRLLTEKARELEAQYQSHISEKGDPASTDPRLNPEIQERILSLLKLHSRLEKSQNAEIYPAIRKPRENLKFQQAEQLCKELDCQSDLSRKDLSW